MDATGNVRILAEKMQMQAEAVQVVAIQQKARTFSDYLTADTKKRRRFSFPNFSKKRGKGNE